MRAVDTPAAVTPASPQPRGRRLALVAVAALAVIAAIGIPALWLGGDDRAAPAAPEGFGTWAPLPDAPIGSRAFPVAAWTGSEAVFWAGASLARNHAYTDGAAYDPVAGAWRPLAVPGWGHPGLSGVLVDGALLVTAKGGVTRLDVADGTTVDLPEPVGFNVDGIVAARDELWAVGPVNYAPGVPAEVGIARFDATTGGWVNGPVVTGSLDDDALFAAFEAQPLLWTGSEIVLWYPAGAGLAYDPAAGGLAYDLGTQTWRALAAPVPPEGVVTASLATVVDRELIAVAQVEGAGGASLWAARMVEGSWVWNDLGIASDLTHASLAAAPDWLVVLLPDQPPITYHVPSGAWLQHHDGPLAGRGGTSAVWAGDRLVVWGGLPTSAEADPGGEEGATWVPPPRA